MIKIVELLILCLVATIFTGNTFAQEVQKRKTILKTNLLNIPFIPSFHFEQQIGKAISLNLNSHNAYISGNIPMFDCLNLLSNSLNMRKYWDSKKQNLEEIYTSIGLNILYGYEANKFKIGDFGFGPEARIGFQNSFKRNNRFLIDFNVGSSLLFEMIKNGNRRFNMFMPKVMFGIGYRIAETSIHYNN